MKRLSTLLLSCVITFSNLFAQSDWENPQVFERNQTEPHTPLAPYLSVDDAIKGQREATEFYQSLNGTWKFNWVSTVAEAPQDFYENESKVSGWEEIDVPSNWQMKGYGHAMFRNVTMEFPELPPTVPEYYNPVGSYFRTFEVGDNWDGRQLFLHFEGVKSASYLWVNGKEVGYNQGGFEPAEYDVTSFVKAGKNTVAVKVLRYSDGSFLENQDMWRLSGIYRNVYLFATPKLHMQDYFISTDFDENYENATLKVEVETNNYSDRNLNGSIRFNLLDDHGKSVFENNLPIEKVSVEAGEKQVIVFEKEIFKPKQWSAEKPNLYTLSMELLDKDRNVIEAYAPKMGFRETEVKGNAVYVNGMPIKFNGVNSHVHHPETGKTMDIETIKKDFEIMKQFNINLVRTSHYPPSIEYLELANENGIYIIDEAGVECHRHIYLSGDPDWKSMFIDRGRKMVKRDRNNPSIVFWSAGNEAGVGDNLKVMMEEGKRLDPSRPKWMYGGNTFEIPFEDIIGPRYWRPFHLKKLAEQDASEDDRPSFQDEYLAATGNSMGGLDDYWDLIWKYPRLTGGAIWDWVSPSIKHPLRILKDQSNHGNDGAIMGRATLVEGKMGLALDLSGHDEWVEFYRDSSLDISEEITLELWVKPRKFIHTNYFLAKGNHAYGLIQKDAKTIEFYIHDSLRYSATCDVPADWENEWHHLVGIYDGLDLKLYVDGALKDTLSHDGKIMNSPFPVTIGRDSENHHSETSGMLSNAIIDQVRIYDKAIPVDQLKAQIPENAVIFMDFEDEAENGHFYMTGLEGRTYGLVWADRTVQPEMWQVKKSAQPVKVEAIDRVNGKYRFTNRFNFTNLNELEISYSLGDAHQKEGNVTIDLAPHESKIVDLPIGELEIMQDQELMAENGLIGIISFQLKNDTKWAKKGYEVAWEQITYPHLPPMEQVINDSKIKIEESQDLYIVRGGSFEYSFKKSTGHLGQMKVDGQEIMHDGPLFNVWRAPIANDIDPWSNWQHRTQEKIDGLGRSVDNHWRTFGIDKLIYQLDKVEVIPHSDHKVDVIVHESSYTSTKNGAFINKYIYEISSKGNINLHVETSAKGEMPQWLPKVGLQFQLPQEMQNVAWYGRGPQENYPDRKTGYKIGNYSSTIDDMYVPYLIPQDYGNRTDVKTVKLSNDQGFGLLIEMLSIDDFNFSVHNYSTDNLERAMYPFQLKKTDRVYLNIDYKVNGLGDTSLATLRENRVLPGNYKFSIKIKPVR